MSHPHNPQQPYGNPQGYGQPGQYPAPYGQPQTHPAGYPPMQQQPAYPPPQQPVYVQQVGRSVTKPAWTLGDIMWVICTIGMAYPIIWLRRRSRTTVTRHGR